MRNIFFDCNFAKEIWLMFGISITKHVYAFEIITNFRQGLKKDANLFWHILSSFILWFIWKFRNEAKFQGIDRSLTGFYRKLTHFKIASEVCCIMNLECDKLLRFLKDGHAEMFIYKMKHGNEWAGIIGDKNAFDKALDNLLEEIRHTSTP